jgi:hypothetical protein
VLPNAAIIAKPSTTFALHYRYAGHGFRTFNPDEPTSIKAFLILGFGFGHFRWSLVGISPTNRKLAKLQHWDATQDQCDRLYHPESQLGKYRSIDYFAQDSRLQAASRC